MRTGLLSFVAAAVILGFAPAARSANSDAVRDWTLLFSNFERERPSAAPASLSLRLAARNAMTVS